MKKLELSRRDFIRCSSLATVGSIAETLAGQSYSARQDAATKALIQQAGNADSDELRLAYLKQLQDRQKLEPSFKKDLAKLISQINRWLYEEQLDYFSREIRNNKDFDFGISERSALYPLTWLYRGRMVTWYALESGSVWSIPERRREFFGIARGFFEKYAEAFPENKIAKMYLGHPIKPVKTYKMTPKAPEWAVYQRESLERLTDIIEWWIDNRMQEDGQYGGGWGDDCEMWRWWVPVLIGFDSPKISQAQARFSRAMLDQPHMRKGYTTHMSDVEHTAEDSADVITPMMHLDPENDLWRQSAIHLAELMETLWTGQNERGFLQFKSTYFTADRIDTNPARTCDTVYHPRAVQPALLYWQRTGDERLTQLFSAWMDTWVDAASRAERGKPAGILPTAIHWPDGCVGGIGLDWWNPQNHGESTLYQFPSAMNLMTHTLLLTYYMTGREKYIDPIRSMAEIRLKYLNTPPEKPPAAGTEAWCASKLGGLISVISKYRFLTGKGEFDAFLIKQMSLYMRFKLLGDQSALVTAVRQNAEALRINFEGYTSEVRYTDRVLRFPALFGDNGILGKALGAIPTPDPAFLYSMVTGDPGGAEYFPLNAVRWMTPPRDIAALVTQSQRNLFEAELFHFGEEQRPMSAELYLLGPGRYRLKLVVGENRLSKPFEEYDFNVRKRRTRVTFTLPPRQLCALLIQRR